MKVALYANNLNEAQGDYEPKIPDQLFKMREWCKQQSYSVVVEYVEFVASPSVSPGPVFKKMIGDACTTPPPFEGIILHNDSCLNNCPEFGHYERILVKFGVQILSVNHTPEPDNKLAYRIFALFDEYQRMEQAKQILAGMNDNARLGYFNGSKPPFGYSAKEIEPKDPPVSG